MTQATQATPLEPEKPKPKPKTQKSKTVQVPREMFAKMRKAISVARSDAATGHVLTDSTMVVLDDAYDAIMAFIEARSGL